MTVNVTCQNKKESEGLENSADDDVSSTKLEDECQGEDFGAVRWLLVTRVKLPPIGNGVGTKQLKWEI